MTQELRTLLQRFPDDIELRTTLLEIVSRNGDVAGVEQLLESAPQSAGDDYQQNFESKAHQNRLSTESPCKIGKQTGQGGAH